MRNENNKPDKLSYTENLYKQIKKYEGSIAANPLMPLSFKETAENVLPEMNTLIEESFLGNYSGNLLDVVMTKIKNIESLQTINLDKIKSITRQKDKISTQKAVLADLVHKYTESLDVEEIKTAVRSNKLFQKQKMF